MKINSVVFYANQNYLRKIKKSALPKNTQINSFSNAPAFKMITFSGKKIQNQIALVAAEAKDYCPVSGISPVLSDYSKYVFTGEENTPLIIPYYNGELILSKNKNEILHAKVLKKNNCPIYTNADLTKVKIDELENAQKNPKAKNKYWELQFVTRNTMDWQGEKTVVEAYKVKGKPHFMIYTDITAQMPSPYKKSIITNGKISTENVAHATNSKNKGEYGKFSKALVELLPRMEKAGLNPEHLLLNDAQTAYIPEFIAQKAMQNEEYYKDTSLSFVQHCLDEGYQQKTDMETLFNIFATNNMYTTVKADPEYQMAKLYDKINNTTRATNKYFYPLVSPFVGDDNRASASMIPISYAMNNYINHVSGVSEMYAQDCMNNPNVAKGLTKNLKELNKKGKFSGILNGFNNNDINPEIPIGFPVYKEVTKDNLGNIHNPFLTFSKDMSAEEIIKIKKQNASNLIKRLQKGIDFKYSIAHARGKGITGYLDKKWADKIDSGEDVTLFVSWGRADEQKGMDNVLEAFSRFAKTPEGKNSILIAGGELQNQSAQKAINEKLNKMSTDKDLIGRFAYMDGFAPNAVLASASDASIFPSRWAPCELTDLEAMKYGSTPIVTNLQGLKQKNFDIRNPNEADKATSYKTNAHFFMDEKEVIERSNEYNVELNKLIEDYMKKYKINKTIAIFQIKQTDDYKSLWRKITDELTVQDLVKAMQAKTTETFETKSKLIKNAMNIKCGWENNNKLHPDENKSSKDLYWEKHINSKSLPMTHSLFFSCMLNAMSCIQARNPYNTSIKNIYY